MSFTKTNTAVYCSHLMCRSLLLRSFTIVCNICIGDLIDLLCCLLFLLQNVTCVIVNVDCCFIFQRGHFVEYHVINLAFVLSVSMAYTTDQTIIHHIIAAQNLATLTVSPVVSVNRAHAGYDLRWVIV